MTDLTDFDELADFDPFAALEGLRLHQANAKYVAGPLHASSAAAVLDVGGWSDHAPVSGSRPVRAGGVTGGRAWRVTVAACIAAAAGLVATLWLTSDPAQEVVVVQQPDATLTTPAVELLREGAVLVTRPTSKDHLIVVDHGEYRSYGTLTNDFYVGVTTAGVAEGTRIQGVTGTLVPQGAETVLEDISFVDLSSSGGAAGPDVDVAGSYLINGEAGNTVEISSVEPCVYEVSNPLWDGLGLCSGGDYYGSFRYHDDPDSSFSAVQGWHAATADGSGFEVLVINVLSPYNSEVTGSAMTTWDQAG